MKKIILISAAAAVLFAGEFQYGNGTFKLKGGFIGLNTEKSTDISTYTVKENHKNVFSSGWYYGYEFTWYKSDTLTNAQQNIVSASGAVPVSLTIPAIYYKYEGLDVNLIFGKDLCHKGENSYFGTGVLLGLSIPYIDTGKSSSNNDSTSNSALNAMKKSRTKIKTFKIGPVIQGSYKIIDKLSIYGKGVYAYQSGNVKNDYANVDTHVNGNFEEIDFGLKFQPYARDYKLGFLTFKTRLYFTFGYRYTYWKLKDLSIDVTGSGLSESGSDMNMKSSVVYAGMGYSF